MLGLNVPSSSCSNIENEDDGDDAEVSQIQCEDAIE